MIQPSQVLTDYDLFLLFYHKTVSFSFNAVQQHHFITVVPDSFATQTPLI